MKLLGFDIAWRQGGLTIKRLPTLTPAAGRGGWWPVIRESVLGAWQSNVTVTVTDVLTYAAVYACVTLIASDIGKLRIKLVQQDDDGIWSETENPAFSPVLRKPNRYQTRITFLIQWLISKLVHGNTYVLKERDQRGVVVALYILDPQRVTPLVAPDGSVYYDLQRDDLSGQPQEQLVVPAREIIHDVMVPLYHPLCGVSPITACGVAAVQGLRIQDNSATFFANGSAPGGVLSAPRIISQADADRVKAYWDTNFGGANRGKVAVVGDGLTYAAVGQNAVDSQLIEQLRWTAENVCTAFRVPPYMIGVGAAPSYNNIEALNAQYYAQCLQTLIESIELLLDEGLELKKPYGTELELKDLLRMDTATRVKAAGDSLLAGMSPDEVRREYFDLGKVPGGASPMSQQQNFSLAALAKRDNSADPFGKAAPPAPAPPAPAAGDDLDADEVERRLDVSLRKDLELAA